MPSERGGWCASVRGECDTQLSLVYPLHALMLLLLLLSTAKLMPLMMDDVRPARGHKGSPIIDCTVPCF